MLFDIFGCEKDEEKELKKQQLLKFVFAVWIQCRVAEG